MLADAPSLGDDLSKWDARFKQDIHGLILVTGDTQERNDEVLVRVKKIFHVGEETASIQEVIQVAGKVRPGNEDGHEQ
jgi:hypothetical protein